ncbi:MAG: polyphosphate polymerase domain-containing protein [Sedimenticola sp.]
MASQANNSDRDLKQFRYERKFLITDFTYSDVLYFINCSNAAFIEEYPKRVINNIYFDTPDYISFHENIDGISDRVKTRIRWYGEKFNRIKNPVLEFKIKENMLGKKMSYKLKGINIEIGSSLDAFFNLVMDSPFLPYRQGIKLLCKVPILANRYKREYYKSYDGRFRLTVDENVKYIPIYNNKLGIHNSSTDHRSVIVELKYASHLDFEARKITSEFPFRSTKNSKYVNGVFSLFG